MFVSDSFRLPVLPPKCVSIGYTREIMKDVGLRIRLQSDLREQFLETCRSQDKPAAQVLREFMRGYISTHESNGKTASGKKGAGRAIGGRGGDRRKASA